MFVKIVGHHKYWDIMSYIMSQYLIPAIINRDIIYALCTSNTPTTAIFRTFKKSTAPYKVYNMGLRYINTLILHKK
jgi:hypothetical protein